MQFFDRLIPLLAKKPDFPNKVIIVKEDMDKVNDLLQIAANYPQFEQLSPHSLFRSAKCLTRIEISSLKVLSSVHTIMLPLCCFLYIHHIWLPCVWGNTPYY